MSLISHLGRDFVTAGQLRQEACFVDCMGKWFLTVDMFTHLDGHGRSDGVRMVRRRDSDCVNAVPFFFQHDTEIGIASCLGVLVKGLACADLIDVAESNDVFPGATGDVDGAFAAGADGSNI